MKNTLPLVVLLFLTSCVARQSLEARLATPVAPMPNLSSQAPAHLTAPITSAPLSNTSDLKTKGLDTVWFIAETADLTPQAKATLDQQANWLASNDYSVFIEGHADEKGTREYNVALGAKRAAAVRTYLIGRGISPSRLEVTSLGKERPLSLCSEESCWTQNRRAVTVVR